MALQVLPQRFAEDAHAAAVHHAQAHAPARNARSTNFSTARVASSTFCPMTLISVGALSSSRASETLIPLGAGGGHRIGSGARRPPRRYRRAAPSSSSGRRRPRRCHRRNGAAPWRRGPATSAAPCRRPRPAARCAAGRAGSPASAPVAWATTVESNCSRNSRRSLAMRRSASLESFEACARSCTAFTVSRAWYSKSRSRLSSFFSISRIFSRCSFRPSLAEVIALARHLLLARAHAVRSVSTWRSSACSRSRKRAMSCACEVSRRRAAVERSPHSVPAAARC